VIFHCDIYMNNITRIWADEILVVNCTHFSRTVFLKPFGFHVPSTFTLIYKLLVLTYSDAVRTAETLQLSSKANQFHSFPATDTNLTVISL
jgi:hypothetical protein